MIPRKYALECAGLLIQQLKYRKKSVNYYQNYHNTTRKNYHQKNDVGVKKVVSGVRCQDWKGFRCRVSGVSNYERNF